MSSLIVPATTDDFSGEFLHQLIHACTDDKSYEDRRNLECDGFIYCMLRRPLWADYPFKFGVSRDPVRRKQQLAQRYGPDIRIELVTAHYVGCMRSVESIIHRYLAPWRCPTDREWFRIDPSAALTLMNYVRLICFKYQTYSNCWKMHSLKRLSRRCEKWEFQHPSRAKELYLKEWDWDPNYAHELDEMYPPLRNGDVQ